MARAAERRAAPRASDDGGSGVAPAAKSDADAARSAANAADDSQGAEADAATASDGEAAAVVEPQLRLMAAIDAYDRASPVVHARLENLRAAAGDFLRVAAETHEDTPIELRDLVAAIVERI